MTKLSDIPKGSKIRLRSVDEKTGKPLELIFHHLDGMYSYCTTEDGRVAHLSTQTPLSMGADGVYEITKDK